MKPLVFEVVIEGGCDEWWEEVQKQKKPEKCVSKILEELFSDTYFDAKVKFLGYQSEDGLTQLELDV
jgi:hypothetical protein